MIKALLFDMDGVLIDSESWSADIGIEYFESIGIKVSKKDFAHHLGCGEKAFFDGVAKDFNAAGYSYPKASSFFKNLYKERIKNREVALPGGKALINRAKGIGLKVAVASSAPEWKVWENIAAIGLDKKELDLVITESDVVRNKPFGDIYKLCMIKLGIAENEAVVFEDTTGGIKAGKAAGATVIALSTTIDSESAFSSGADGVISDLSAFPCFDDYQSFDRELNAICGISKDSIVYGANYIPQRKNRISPELTRKSAIDAAWKAWENAYAPYSKFKVGAALVSARTGRIYNGANVENSSYGGTICAERSAIVSAIASEGTIGIELLVIVSDDDPPAPPCAICRQFISEFASPDSTILLISKSGVKKEYKFSELLPYPFIMPAMRKGIS